MKNNVSLFHVIKLVVVELMELETTENIDLILVTPYLVKLTELGRGEAGRPRLRSNRYKCNSDKAQQALCRLCIGRYVYRAFSIENLNRSLSSGRGAGRAVEGFPQRQ